MRKILVSIIVNIKHDVELCEHNEDKLQEIQNSIMQENMSNCPQPYLQVYRIEALRQLFMFGVVEEVIAAHYKLTPDVSHSGPTLTWPSRKLVRPRPGQPDQLLRPCLTDV